MKIIIESPLKGSTPEEFQRNFRYLLWCCRAEYEAGNEPIASHLICPWFMDDRIEKERGDGIGWSWMWDPDVPHHFYDDLQWSRGMLAAKHHIEELNVQAGEIRREWYAKSLPYEMWESFERGEWPPHTPGFDMARIMAPLEVTRTGST